MAKDKGRGVRKHRVRKLPNRRAKEKIQSSKSLAEGNSCGLSADEERTKGGDRAGTWWPPAAAAALSRCGSGCSGRRRRVSGCEGEVGTAPPQRAPAVSGAPSSPQPTRSAPPTLPSSSSQLPRPGCSQPRQWGSTVCVSSLDEVTHPRREVIWRLPWWVLPSGLRERLLSLPR